MDITHNSKVVEVSSYPGLDADYKYLPNNVATVDVIKKSIGKISESTIYPKKINKNWIKLFCNASSCQILSDSFWYIWHQEFGTEENNSKLLLERISSVFVKIFITCGLSNTAKDEFLEVRNQY